MIGVNLCPFEPGSLNDRVCEAITKHGKGGFATQSAVIDAVGAEAGVTAVAIGAMVRDGYVLRDSRTGALTLSGAIDPQYAYAMGKTPTQSATATPPPAASISAPKEKAMAKLIHCNGPCGRDLAPGEFYAGNKKCKDCYNERQKELKRLRAQGKSVGRGGDQKSKAAKAARAAKPEPAPKPTKNLPAVQTVVPIAAAAVYVIPSTGHLECKVEGQGAGARAHVAQIPHWLDMSLPQLVALRDWADSVIKRELSR